VAEAQPVAIVSVWLRLSVEFIGKNVSIAV
jgi:hypothetical protein